jgi:hypothetical protein
LVIVPYGGVADIGLSSYSPFRRRARQPFRFEDVEQLIPRIQSRDRGVHELHCSPQSQAD